MSTERTARRSRETTGQQRELELVRDIAEAFFHASTPLEVYRLALARVTPLVNASFSSVFLCDEGDADLLRLVCASNWPQSSARFLSQLRIRVGRGPTGRAVAEARAIDVEDVFADVSLRDWWEPARELGFASLISLPLVKADRPMGAVSFYYEAPHQFNDEERVLLALIAEQLSMTAERATRLEALHLENDLLRDQVEALSAQIAKLTDAQRSRTAFLANIGHELRTPLAAVLGQTQALRDGQAGPLTAQQSNVLARVDTATTVALRLINNLITLTELQLGRITLAAAPQDAVQLAQRAAELLPVPAGIRFALESAESSVAVHTDAAKVLRILESLLSNAFKFTQQGEVVLSVRRLGFGEIERIEWCVRDSGSGIARDRMPEIFDEFRQVDGSSTRLYAGTGLGLPLSLQLARMLGGEILLESEIGIGSTFTLRLPGHL